MLRFRFLLLTGLISALAASTAHAQLGVSVYARSVNGDETDAADSERRGFEARAFYDFNLARQLSIRAELAGTQTRYRRDTTLGPLFVSENAVEVATLARLSGVNGVLSGTYALAGPVASFRVNCGVSGGFVDCGNTPDRQVGYTLGLGYVSPLTERRALVFELRFSDRVVGGGGSSLLSLGLGLQGR